MMTTEHIAKIQILLALPKKIVIIPHRNPDGDAMGSTLGLAHFLKKMNHEAVVIAPNEFPDFLAWLPESENVLIFEKNIENCTKIIEQSDLIFTLDFNALHRMGEIMEKIVEKCTATFIMIDHHELPGNYSTFTFSDITYGSTCEMVYDFIYQLGYEQFIDKKMATCLYTGIVTDSGSFRFPKTTSKTHKCVADLLDKGANNAEIHTSLFDNSSYNRLLLLGKALQNLKILNEFSTSYITLNQEELDGFGNKKGDTEGIVNYGLSLKGIDFTAFFIENKEEGIIKISFRSQGNFDVNQFARTYFEGGGHKNAAGGKSFLTLDETVQKFISILATEKINK
jgi:phosphoesterase RecJ-like protein